MANPPRKQKVNTCIWCHHTPLTREHLWPEWYAKIFPKSKNKYEHFRLNTQFTDEAIYVSPTSKIRAGDPSSLQLKVVCQNCNGTWMSDVEQKGKKVLLPMMLGQEYGMEIDDIQALRDWIALKTIVGECDDSNSITISQAAAHAFYNSRTLVDDWQIWIARYCGKDWITRRRHNTYCVDLKENIPTPGRVKINTQSTAMVGGQLFMLAITTSSEHLKDFDLAPAFDDIFFKIHPNADPLDKWPTSEMIGDEGADFFASILNRFFESQENIRASNVMPRSEA